MADDPPEGLLTDDPVFEGLLRAIAAAPVPPREAEQALPLEVGRTIAAFHLLEVIGRGGTGVVYRAQDTRLGREVALKLLWGSPGSEAHTERLLFEARTAAAFSDPRIASIYEVGEVEGRAFIAMELVRGTSLRAHLARGPLPLRAGLALAIEVARALASIHAAGWVHQDVKPDNIAVGDDGLVKLLDFGIARPSGPRSAGEPIAGTPEFIAPEQRDGRAVDARADVHAFGVLLQQILTGRASRGRIPLPFAGPDGRALARLIEECLAPDPERRPASGAALVNRLEAVLDGARRRRRWLRVGAAVVFVVSAFVAVTRPRQPPAPPALRSVRLTGNQLTRPISAAALSWDGQHFAYVDDDGLVVGETNGPDRTRRIDFETPADFVEAIPGSPDWMVLTSTANERRTVWRLGGDGTSPRAVITDAFNIVSINPVDGRLALVGTHSLSVRNKDGDELWSYLSPSTRLLGSASWSPDGARLAVTFGEIRDSGLEPCLEVWEGERAQARFTLCSARLTQTFAPVVSTWGPEGELIYALSDAPGTGRGSSVLMQRFGQRGEVDGPPLTLLSLEQQFLSSIGMSRDRALLTLRQETALRPMLAELSSTGIVGDPVRLGASEFDGRLSAWADARSIWSMSYREWVPRIRILGVDDGKETAPELPGWAQSWPVPIAGGGTFFWYADRPASDEAPTWKLARTSSAGVARVETASEPKERLSVTGAPPSTFQVRCAIRAPTCLLGSPEDGGFVISRLSPPSARAERLFRIDGFQPIQGAWQVLPDASAVVVGDARGALVTYALDGRVLALVQLQELFRIRSIGVDPSSGAIFASGHGPSIENFRIVRVQDGREEVIRKHGAIVYLDVLPSPDGRRLAFVEKAIDTDIWVSFR